MSKLRSIALLMVLVVTIATVSYVQAKQVDLPPGDPYAPSANGVPDVLGDYKVLAVLTPGNTACMIADHKRLVLQTTQLDQESFLQAYNPQDIDQALQEHALPRLKSWEILVVGPGMSREQFISETENWNRDFRDRNCATLGPVREGSDWGEIYRDGVGAGFALIENLSAGSYTNDNAQSVFLIAPSSLGSSQDTYSAFLNNVKTDSSTFFVLQNGFLFPNGEGRVVYTDINLGLVAQSYGIPYVGGDPYRFTITYTSSTWFMCAEDYNNPSTYTCMPSSGTGVGTTLARDLNTSIWVEDRNTNGNWYSGFSNPWQAYGALIYRNGIPQNWGSQHRHTVHECASSWPVTSAIGGSLTGGSTAYFYLGGVPLRCP